MESRLFVTITAARIRAASGSQADRTEASKKLREILAEARKAGFLTQEFEARLALGEIETSSGDSANGRAHLAGLEQDAAQKGFRLIARKADEGIQDGTCGSKVDAAFITECQERQRDCGAAAHLPRFESDPAGGAAYG